MSPYGRGRGKTRRRCSPPPRLRWRTPSSRRGTPLNGNGFYRFKIGDFHATVISDGYGQTPNRPILVMNASEAEIVERTLQPDHIVRERRDIFRLKIGRFDDCQACASYLCYALLPV